MLTGKKLGEAIKSAIVKKGLPQTAVARHFGVTPPSVQDWINKGTISKEKLPELWKYFSDVVDAAHWGLEGFPAGTVSDVPSASASYKASSIQDARARKWPFRHLDLAKIAALSDSEARELEGAWRDSAKRLNFDVETAARSGKRRQA